MNDYCIGTWSRYVQRSSIEKWDTEADKALLPAPTARNQAHKTSRSFVINHEGRTNGRRRLNKVSRQVGIRRTVGEDAAGTLEDAFGGVE